MEIKPITEEVFQRGMILGYLPDEYIGEIERASLESQSATIAAIDEILPKLDDISASYLFRWFMGGPKSNHKIVNALFHSRKVTAWINRNHEVLNAIISGNNP